MQKVVDIYNKLVQAKGNKLWNDTCKFFIKEDLKATDNLQALSKAGIFSTYSAITKECIDKLKSHTSDLIRLNAMYEPALTKMSYIINTIQSKQSTTSPPVAAASGQTNRIQIILSAITN